VGFSLGGGPAARLAAERPVTGTILVTPFDSLARLAAGHMPWAPVRALIRHRMPVADDLARSTAPVAVITAGRDTVVPAARSAPVAEAAPDLVFRAEVDGSGHNDLYTDPAFDRAMRQAMAAVTGG
ncbi:MAG: alpha/beta hydrolase, partial [Alphaproteobacteria bacterium]|nr:alpha/beta hydrolase [Alphaproteobacteria bacterium]